MAQEPASQYPQGADGDVRIMPGAGSSRARTPGVMAVRGTWALWQFTGRGRYGSARDAGVLVHPDFRPAEAEYCAEAEDRGNRRDEWRSGRSFGKDEDRDDRRSADTSR